MSVTDTPEIGRECRSSNFATNYHDVGAGIPVMLIHGSVPGVSAWANWWGAAPRLSKFYRLIAVDMVGFGYTGAPQGSLGAEWGLFV